MPVTVRGNCDEAIDVLQMISIVGTHDYECVQKLTSPFGGMQTGSGNFWRFDFATEWEEYFLLHTDWTSHSLSFSSAWVCRCSGFWRGNRATMAGFMTTQGRDRWTRGKP